MADCLLQPRLAVQLHQLAGHDLPGGRRGSPSIPSPNTQRQKGGGSRLVAVAAIKHRLTPLPYKPDALEPHMSERAVDVHYERHHRGYLDALNRQLAAEEEELARLPLEQLVRAAYNHGNPRPLFNNASQVLNHDLYWESMKPEGGGKPEGELLELIQRDFGSFEGFQREFKEAAARHFGSGWTWLAVKVTDPYPECFYKAPPVLAGKPDERVKIGRLVVESSANAINPLVWEHTPLLALNVWEHAYYIDHLNDRRAHIDTFLDHLVAWDVVDQRLQRAKNFILMHMPEPREDRPYEKDLSDAEWLEVHRKRRSKKPEDEQAEIQKRLDRNPVKVKTMVRSSSDDGEESWDDDD